MIIYQLFSFIRAMDVLTFFAFIFTVLIIHVSSRHLCSSNGLFFEVHSSKAMGAYKYCLYQIVLSTFIGQQLTLPVPIFVFPIIGKWRVQRERIVIIFFTGAYQYVDFTDNPHVIHAYLVRWFLFIRIIYYRLFGYTMLRKILTL